MIPRIRPLSDGEELVLAEDTPFNPLDPPEPDPHSAALRRRSEAASAPTAPRRPRRFVDEAGL